MRNFRYYEMRYLDRQLKKIILIETFCAIGLILLILSLHTYYEKNRIEIVENMDILLNKVEMLDESYKLMRFERLPDKEEENTQNAAASAFDLTEAEKEYIVRVCMAEAGSNYEGCLAVAQCIQNRAVLWSKTPYEIVTAYRQFAPPRKGELYAESIRAVEDVFNHSKKAFPDSNVTHFYSGNSEPYWAHGKTYIGEVGGNKFFI